MAGSSFRTFPLGLISGGGKMMARIFRCWPRLRTLAATLTQAAAHPCEEWHQNYSSRKNKHRTQGEKITECTLYSFYKGSPKFPARSSQPTALTPLFVFSHLRDHRCPTSFRSDLEVVCQTDTPPGSTPPLYPFHLVLRPGTARTHLCAQGTFHANKLCAFTSLDPIAP